MIEKLQTQMQSGENVYDAYVNDSDLIGTHARYGYVVPLSDFMSGEGADVTSPTLDLGIAGLHTGVAKHFVNSYIEGVDHQRSPEPDDRI